MRYSLFPRSGERISKLGFGAMGLSGAFGEYSESELVNSVLHCMDKGVNFIDTARAYGPSERIIGLALKEWQGEKPFIATKISPQKGTGWGYPVPISETYPKGSLRASVETSLSELGIEAVDLVQLHQYWPQWDETDYWLEELGRLKEEGKIKFIGISLTDHRHDLALSIIKTGLIDAVQTIINIFDPLAFDSLIPFCIKHQVAVIARCILDEGGLTGFLREDMVFEENDFRKIVFDAAPRKEYMERVDHLKNYIPEHAGSLAKLAIKFASGHPGVTTAICSMNVTVYADENIAAMDETPLTEEIFEELRIHHRWVRNFYDKSYW